MYLYDDQCLERHTACYIHMTLKNETCACTCILIFDISTTDNRGLENITVGNITMFVWDIIGQDCGRIGHHQTNRRSESRCS
jgi:hypothetical protein